MRRLQRESRAVQGNQRTVGRKISLLLGRRGSIESARQASNAYELTVTRNADYAF